MKNPQIKLRINVQYIILNVYIYKSNLSEYNQRLSVMSCDETFTIFVAMIPVPRININ